MQILDVTFSNLNSLRGKFQIDFTDPGLAGRGVFLVFGPTGAGKTTIFDAISLALYGRTPRLDAVNDAHNDIMSKGAADCLAEARFAVNGAEYRARFAQKIGNKGKLGKPERIIFDGNGGVVAEGIRNCETKINELTQLTAEQFMQTVMLPQGGFADFLKAAPKDRGDILRQLTRAGEYATISRKAHALYDARQNAAEICQASITGMTSSLMDAETAAAKKAELRANQEREKEIKSEIDILDKVLQRAARQKELRERRDQLAQEETELQKAENAFASEGARLQNHQRAVNVAPAWTASATAANRLTEERGELQRKEGDLPEKQRQEQEQAAAATTAQQAHAAAQQAQNAAQPLLAAADALLSKRDQLKNDRDRLFNEWKGRDASQKEAAIHKKKAENAFQAADEALRRLAPPPATDDYARGLAGLDANALRKEEDGQRQARDLWNAAATALNTAAQTHADLAQRETGARAAAATASNLTESLEKAQSVTPERRKTRDIAQENLANAQLAAKYAADRAGLRDGAPCPLCGATHHPLAGQSDAEAADRLAAAKARLQEAERALETSEKAERKLESDQARADAQQKDAQAELEKAQQTWDTAWAAVGPAMNATGSPIPAPDALDAALANAEAQVARHAAALETVARQSQFASKRQQLESDRTLAKQASDAAKANWKEKNEAAQAIEAQGKETREKLNDANAKLSEALKAWPGAATPNNVRARLQQEVTDKATAATAAQGKAEQAKQAREQLEADIAAARGKIAAAQTAANDAAKKLQQALAANGFPSEDDFHAARLEPGMAKELERQQESLTKRSAALAARQKDLAKDEADLAAAPALPWNGTPEEAQARRDAAGAERGELQKSIGALGQELQNHQNAVAKSVAAMQELARLQAEAGRWKKLDDLIGGATIDRFSRYAQQITVRQLVALANRHLARLSRRYELRANEENANNDDAGLELLIYDQYNGGRVRPTNTLSGGENFLVSLALALGLAELGGGEGQVDSLFLDEGFGTLDGDTLNTALDALAKLHGDGRTIGVISHVEGLRERLPSQIEVRPRGNGWSEVLVNGASAAIAPDAAPAPQKGGRGKRQGAGAQRAG